MPTLCGADSIYCGNITPEITLFTPYIRNVYISPNPVNQNSSFKIDVDVIEIDFAVPSAVIIYAGTLNSGQDVI